MKKLWYLCVIALLSMGCSTETEVPATEKEQPTDEETVVISLGSKFTEREEPLTDWTRAAGGNDLYGFQVWANEKGKESVGNPKQSYDIGTEVGGSNTTPVCCGLFDNLDDVTIELSTKQTYNIEMVYVPNGKNLVYRHSSGSYEYPFMMARWTPTPINKVIYTENDWIDHLDFAWINSMDNSNRGSANFRDNLDFYYGQVLNITPKPDNIISIDLKNMIWGLTLRAKKVAGKSYDKLVIKLNVGQMVTKDFYMTIDPNKEVSELVIPKILTNGSNWERYLDSDYSARTRMTIGTDEKPSDIISAEVNIKRNVMKIIEFDATNEKVDNGVDVVIDDEGMKDETEIL